MECGHSWRAGMLEGWRLHHDPNLRKEQLIENVDSDVDIAESSLSPHEIQDIEGNESRDIWKKTAFMYCKQVKYLLLIYLFN